MAAAHFTDANFEEEVLKSELPVLVDFYAEWCGPCKMMAPVIDEIAGEYEGKWKIGKCNVDDAPEMAQKYGVQSIPTLLFIKDGEVVDKKMGVQSKDALSEILG
ncbi:thioredoxin [Candidatus Peregrinibacteria bacterium]|jgi:thioredoxin 1|nr:thioredoxin [Candidatus Peregrinibacteria bacterium]MBT7736692.1 thioredoxin [Candidatus Peregrinibacteria bacterium]